MDRRALIGLLSGVSLVIATLIGVALVNTHQAEGADVFAKPVARDCSLSTKPSEQGYDVIPPNEACARVY